MSRAIAALLLAGLAVPALAQPLVDPSTARRILIVPVPLGEAVGQFEQICLDSRFDHGRFDAAIGRSRWRFRTEQGLGTPAPDVRRAPEALFNFHGPPLQEARTFAPGQCNMEVVLRPAEERATIHASLEAALSRATGSVAAALRDSGRDLLALDAFAGPGGPPLPDSPAATPRSDHLALSFQHWTPAGERRAAPGPARAGPAMIVPLALALLVSLQGPSGEWNCDDAQSQMEMNVCAAIDFERADAELNALWPALIAAAREADREIDRDYDDRPTSEASCARPSAPGSFSATPIAPMSPMNRAAAAWSRCSTRAAGPASPASASPSSARRLYRRNKPMFEIMAAAALLATSADQATPGDAFTAIPAGNAVAYFRRLCVDTLPELRAFGAALNAEPAGWRRYQKRIRGNAAIGHFWRSTLGEISYVNLPGLPSPETNPACHYAFRTGPDFSHDAAARALASAIGLDAGRETGSRRAPQTHWKAGLRTACAFASSSAPGSRTSASRRRACRFPPIGTAGAPTRECGCSARS